MAGLAGYADELWRSSVIRIHNMSKQNEASIARHRALADRLSNINPDVRDARERILPDIETRRTEFRGDVRLRAKVADERYARIEQSKGDAIPFRDFCTREADADVANAEDDEGHVHVQPRPKRGDRRRHENTLDVVRGGILASLRSENATEADLSTHAKRARAETAAARQKRAGNFHDGKAKAAMARAQTHRAAFAAQVAARRRAREDAQAVSNDAEAVSTWPSRDVGEDEEKASRQARLRATARARFRKVGLIVKMGMRAANAMEDVSAEGRAARKAEREAAAAAANEAKAKHNLDALSEKLHVARKALLAAETELAEAEARAAEAGGIAARARDIFDELVADKQLDAASLAEKNVEAWRARAATDEAHARELRDKRDELALVFEAAEVQRRVAEDVHAVEQAAEKVAREDAERLDARAAETRGARALVMQRVTREVLTRVRHAGDVESEEEEESESGSSGCDDTDEDWGETEVEEKTYGRVRVAGLAVKARLRVAKGTETKQNKKFPSAETRRVAAIEVATAAAAVGVRPDITESLAAVRLAARALADDTSAAARGAAAAADDAERRLKKRVAELISARVAADDARAWFHSAMVAACEASAPGDSRETTFTLDGDARVGRRLVAVPGPASASPAFLKGVTPAWRLKPGLNLVVAVSERNVKDLETNPVSLNERGDPPRLASLVETAVPPAPRVGDEDDDVENAEANAAIANARAAAEGDEFDVFDTRGRRQRVDDERRDRRGSVGAAMRVVKAAVPVDKWAKRARERGLVAAEEEDFEAEYTSPAKPSATANAEDSSGFNSVFRPKSKTHVLTALDKPIPMGNPSTKPPAEASGKELPKTRTQLLSRFVRAQRACARAEIVAERAFRERHDARIVARRLRDVADAFELAVPAANLRRDIIERACAAGVATLAEGEARYIKACLAQGPRAARIVKLEMTDTAYAAAVASASMEVDTLREDIKTATKALDEACAALAITEDALEAAKHVEARAVAVAEAHDQRRRRVIEELRASTLGTRPSVDPRAATTGIDDIDHEFRMDHESLINEVAAASLAMQAARFECRASAAPVTQARLRRETATRALAAAIDARDDARRRHSAAAAVTSLDAESDRLAEAASDAASRAAVEGHAEPSMRRLALEAVATIATTLTETAERRARETRKVASGHDAACAADDALARRCAHAAAKTDLAQAKHDLVLARDAEHDSAAAVETARVGARTDRRRALNEPVVKARETLAKTVEASEFASRAVAAARAAVLASELACFEADDRVVETRREAKFNKDVLAVDAVRTATTLVAKSKALRKPVAAAVASDVAELLEDTSPTRPNPEGDHTTLHAWTSTVSTPQPSPVALSTKLSALDAALAAAAVAAADLASARETNECATRAVDAARVEKGRADRACAEAVQRQEAADVIDIDDDKPIDVEAASPAAASAAAFFVEATRNAAEAEATAATLRASGPGLDAAVAAAEDAASCAFSVVEETRHVLDQGSSRARAAAEETARARGVLAQKARTLAAATAEKRAASEAFRRASRALRDAREAVDVAREAEEAREARRVRRAEERRRGGAREEAHGRGTPVD